MYFSNLSEGVLFTMESYMIIYWAMCNSMLL